MAQRTSGAVDAVYYPGDEVLFKEKDKSKWSGPAIVTNIIGNKIRMIFGGYERTVPTIDVAHFQDERAIVESNEATEEKETEAGKKDDNEDWKDSGDIPSEWQLENNKDLRPKLHDQIEFKVEGCLKTGVVTRVGKKSGKDKNRCWIKEDDNEYNYDFLSDVQFWRKTNKSVTFKNNVEGDKSTAIKDKEKTGVLHLKSWQSIQRLEEQNVSARELDLPDVCSVRLEKKDTSSQGMDIQNVFSTEVPKRLYANVKIIEAKEEELKRWKEYDTVSQVTQTSDVQTLSSRWVVTEKEGGNYKARLVVRGFEEEVYPQSDSPTASRESFKTFFFSCSK